jgi:hypothetical protein
VWKRAGRTDGAKDATAKQNEKAKPRVVIRVDARIAQDTARVLGWVVDVFGLHQDDFDLLAHLDCSLLFL